MDEQAPSDNPSMTRLRAALERQLGPEETVQWHGWQLGRIDPHHFGIYVFAVPWTAFALFWTTMAAAAVSATNLGGAGLLAWAFPLFGVPFIAIGAFMLARPFVPLWERGRVLYVVTDRRALKLALGRDLVVTSCPANRIGLAVRREQEGGTGSITLTVKIGRDREGGKETETFDIGPVADIMGAANAIDQIAAASRLPGGVPASALSS